MSNTSSSATIARRLAAEHPDLTFPCPVCGADVNAPNLDGHLSNVHDSDPGVAAADAVWTGSDRRMLILTTFPVVALIVASYPIIKATEGLADDRAILGVLLALFVATSTPVVLAVMGKFTARLELDESSLRLRYALGLLSKRVPAPFKLETGALWELQESGMVKDGYGYRGTNEERPVGAYMRVIDANGRALVLGSKGAPRIAKYWADDDVVDGGRRRRWDIDLQTVELVQLQYHLADRGLLRPKQRESSHDVAEDIV